MILPIIPFRKTYLVKKNIPDFFGHRTIEDILFSSIHFDKLNLCTDVKGEDPLVVSFRAIHNKLQQVPADLFSITIHATFRETTTGAKIDMVLNTNPYLYFFYSIFGAAFIYTAVTEQFVITPLLLIAGVGLYDIFSKKNFLFRFEETAKNE